MFEAFRMHVVGTHVPFVWAFADGVATAPRCMPSQRIASSANGVERVCPFGRFG